MGLFKQMKDLKATVHEAPAMIANAQQLGANAQAMAAANQAAMAQAMAPAPIDPATAEGPDFEPVAGVSLALYAEISKSLASVNYDQSRAPEMAAVKGVDAASWAAAVDGWNSRMTANPAVARQFNALYTGH